MNKKQNRTGKKLKENTGKTPGISSIKSSKMYEDKVIGDNKDETDKKHVGKKDDNKSNEPGKENKDDLKFNPVVLGEQDDSTDKATDKPQTINNLQIKGNSANVKVEPSSETQSQSICGNTEKSEIKGISTNVEVEQSSETQSQSICGNTEKSEIKGNSTNVEVEPSSETQSQSIRGNTEKQVQNTPNINTTVDNHIHVDEKEYNTSNKPNEKHKSGTSKTCTSQSKTGNENKTAPSSFLENTVKQGQHDSKPDQKFQEKTNGGDIKSDAIKTTRFSNFIVGCWRDELIVGRLVMMIVMLVFLLLVCFYYEKKIDNMNEELEKFKTEFFTKIQAESKKQNPAFGTDTCLQNADTQKNLNTEIDTITSNVKILNDAIKSLGDKHNKILTDIQNMSTVLAETISLVWENVTRQSKEITSLNVSIKSFETDTTQKHDRLKLEVDVLNDVVKRNISEKVTSLDQEQEKLHNTIKKAEKIISHLEQDVNKIFPNTFNKGALTAAFGIVIVLVLGLYGYVFLCLRNATGVGRTGPTLMHNNSVAVLGQIPNNPALNNSVCIVSFDEQRCPIHRTLVTPACQGKDIKTFVVRQHASLLDMPRCRLYIMCAEFSERHVIIEQPNLGLGDLKRCTHDAVRKIGGELVILYTRDPGSRRLADGQMFNRDIYCVNDQPELCALRDRGRFISLYDSLTPSQTRKLTETVEECLQ